MLPIQPSAGRLTVWRPLVAILGAIIALTTAVPVTLTIAIIVMLAVIAGRVAGTPPRRGAAMELTICGQW